MSQEINGAKFPLEFDGRGRVATSAGAQHIRESIAQILLTRSGSLPFSKFGSQIPNRVFAPVNAKALIASDAAEAIRRWEPRIELIEVKLLRSNEVAGIGVYEVRYRIKGDAQSDSLRLPVRL